MVSQKSASGTETIRLNKFLALQLGISRREADNLISTDTVTINGKPESLYRSQQTSWLRLLAAPAG